MLYKHLMNLLEYFLAFQHIMFYGSHIGDQLEITVYTQDLVSVIEQDRLSDVWSY